MYLKPDVLLEVIRNTPLIAVDLIVRNPSAEVLLGLRSNRPAKGFWFVPGGRICKNERIKEALKRVAKEELNLNLDPQDTHLIGAFDHIYDDNFSGRPGIGTHYVTLGFEIRISLLPEALPSKQHEAYRWFSVEALLGSEDVHDNTKAYFS